MRLYSCTAAGGALHAAIVLNIVTPALEKKTKKVDFRSCRGSVPEGRTGDGEDRVSPRSEDASMMKCSSVGGASGHQPLPLFVHCRHKRPNEVSKI